MSQPWREKEFLSPTDIAEILSVSLPKAREILYSLPYVKCGAVLRVRTVHFEKLIKKEERK